jgi:hypothetical protein
MTADGAPERSTKLLQIAGTVEAAGEPLDVEDLVRELGGSAFSVRAEIEQLDGMGLLLSGLDEGHPPMLLNAGKQYLARRGLVPHEILRFLPRVIDDLYSREALLQAGVTLVDEFRYQLLNGGAVEHAAHLVPPAFAPAINKSLALNLFAAAVALMARLSEGRPAGCVAEEIMAVGLIQNAESWLEIRSDRQELSEAEATAAVGELRGLFELFEDDDVLRMFDMREPGDAALAGHDPISRQAGVVDQRIESWFKPFGWTIPTGYIGE